MSTLPKLLYRPEEAAHIVSMSRALIYRAIQTGELASVAIGRSRRIRPEALAAWVDRHAEGVSGGVNGPEDGRSPHETASGPAV